MPDHLITQIPLLVFALVVLSWVGFVLVFVTRKTPPKSPDQKKDPRSIPGVVIQGLSFGIVWGFHRPYFTSLTPGNNSLTIVLGVVTILVAFGSVMFTMAAVKTLGKEWSLTARVVQDHKLAIRGPYATVRHPIYTAMLGMLLTTGLATSYETAIIVALIFFMVGTIIRIRTEEALLRETFGAEYDAYTKQVAALIPMIY